MLIATPGAHRASTVHDCFTALAGTVREVDIQQIATQTFGTSIAEPSHGIGIATAAANRVPLSQRMGSKPATDKAAGPCDQNAHRAILQFVIVSPSYTCGRATGAGLRQPLPLALRLRSG